MEVIALTLLVSLCLAGIFIIAFACEAGRRKRRSLERESLLPFDAESEDQPAPSLPPHHDS